MSFNEAVEPIFGRLPENWQLVSIGDLEKNAFAELQTGV
jgi:hypothetical protein